LLEGDVAQQTERVLKNLKAILTHAGLTLSHVVKTTVFLKDMNDIEAMNESSRLRLNTGVATSPIRFVIIRSPSERKGSC
jgi:enamine deaminase RidA (YjgF/YER057c/UK114 family)